MTATPEDDEFELMHEFMLAEENLKGTVNRILLEIADDAAARGEDPEEALGKAKAEMLMFIADHVAAFYQALEEYDAGLLDL